MRQNADSREFALIYGRWPEPGEIAALRQENLTRWIEASAKAAIRPGFRKMLAYWLAS